MSELRSSPSPSVRHVRRLLHWGSRKARTFGGHRTQQSAGLSPSVDMFLQHGNVQNPEISRNIIKRERLVFYRMLLVQIPTLKLADANRISSRTNLQPWRSRFRLVPPTFLRLRNPRCFADVALCCVAFSQCVSVLYIL